MPRVAMIGAGSTVFATRLITDMLTHPELADSTLVSLVDIDPDRLANTEAYARRAVEQVGAGMRIEVPATRREALAGADYVIVMVMIGGVAPFEVDIEVPARFGVDQTVGDTLGPGGVFRGLRTIPFLIDLCTEMEELCPDALLINYANPMAMNCWAMSAATGIRNVGLCHSVQNTSRQLARYCGIPADEVTYWVAGINHMAWFLEFEHDGRDAYRLLREAADDPAIVAQDPIRFDILRHFDYFVTESSHHMSEYVPYYRKSGDVIAAYIPEKWNYPSFWPAEREASQEAIRRKLSVTDPLEIARSAEYGVQIIQAMETNTSIRVNGNVSNAGLITNLPNGCCVEVPCLVDGTGIRPCHVGELPSQLAGLNRTNIGVQELTVQAALGRDRRKAAQAVLLDPLTSALLTPGQIERMVDEMFERQSHELPQFRRPTRSPSAP